MAAVTICSDFGAPSPPKNILSLFPLFPHLFAMNCNLDGEGHGNPLQYSCLENPRDGGAWWAAVYGVAQSQTCLKRLSSSSSNLDSILKSRDFANKGPSSQGYGFSSAHVWM